MLLDSYKKYIVSLFVTWQMIRWQRSILYVIGPGLSHTSKIVQKHSVDTQTLIQHTQVVASQQHFTHIFYTRQDIECFLIYKNRQYGLKYKNVYLVLHNIIFICYVVLEIWKVIELKHEQKQLHCHYYANLYFRA